MALLWHALLWVAVYSGPEAASTQEMCTVAWPGSPAVFVCALYRPGTNVVIKAGLIAAGQS